MPRPRTPGQISIGYHAFIDGLRAIAVLGVLMFHFKVGGLEGGYTGVDVFFVLSGYLITTLIDERLRGQSFSFADFYERRARRILPALLITCALSAVAAMCLLVPHDLREFAKSLKGAVFFFSNVVFDEATGYFADSLSTRPLLHTWSLAVEEQFYLIFPPLLFAVFRLVRRTRPLVWCAVAVLFAASLAWSVRQVYVDRDAAFYLLPSRTWELLAGALIALAQWQLRLPRWCAEVVGAAGLSCIACAFANFDRNTVFPGAAALLPCGGVVLILVSNLRNRTLLGSVLSMRWLVFIGLLSYGLYMYHWPILAFARYFLERELDPLETAIAIAFTVALALASFYGIEAPLRAGRVLRSRRAVFNFSAAGLLLIGVFGIVAVNADGFPRRFSGAALQYAAGGRDKWAWDTCMPSIEKLSAVTLCKVGADAMPPTFLVWGDSHAAALEPAVDARAKALNVAGWVVGYSRCPSLLGAAPLRQARDDHPCLAIADKILTIARDNGIKHVLLASRWDSYIAGWEPGGTETNQDLTLAFDASDGSIATGLAAFRLAFAETIHRLQSMDVDVWVLEQVPPQLIDVPSALAKAVYFNRDIDALRRPYSAVEARRGAANDIFEDYRHSPGVSFIDPAATFCPGKSPCEIAAAGHALYSDGNHLSVFGSLWSQHMLDGFFNSTVQ